MLQFIVLKRVSSPTPPKFLIVVMTSPLSPSALVAMLCPAWNLIFGDLVNSDHSLLIFSFTHTHTYFAYFFFLPILKLSETHPSWGSV